MAGLMSFQTRKLLTLCVKKVILHFYHLKITINKKAHNIVAAETPDCIRCYFSLREIKNVAAVLEKPQETNS